MPSLLCIVLYLGTRVHCPSMGGLLGKHPLYGAFARSDVLKFLRALPDAAEQWDYHLCNDDIHPYQISQLPFQRHFDTVSGGSAKVVETP